MSKKITSLVREVYEYLLEKNKDLLIKEGSIAPTCYAISFDEKNNMSVMPIPLVNLNGPDERRALMVEMSKIFKKEKIKVKMFMLITDAWITKINRANKDKVPPEKDPARIEGLICSASDCFNYARYQIFKITREENKSPVLALEAGDDGWFKLGTKEKSPRDTLLDSFWTEYRKVK